jgi:excisionase family DNA binding protein
METLYSVKEVCGILKIKRVLVSRLIHSGRLRAFKLGGGRLWRIRERDLKRLIRGGIDAPMHSADGMVLAESKSS